MNRTVHYRIGAQKMRGFTLIELLVVVAIIIILLAVLLPSLRSAREQSKTVLCANNVRQFCIAELMYTELHVGYLPMAWDMTPNKFWVDQLYKDGLIAEAVNDNVKGIHRCPTEDRPTMPGTKTHYGQNRFAYTWNVVIKMQQITAPAVTPVIFDASITPNYEQFQYDATLSANANITANRHAENRSRNYGFIDAHVECTDRYQVARGVYRWVLINWDGSLIEK